MTDTQEFTVSDDIDTLDAEIASAREGDGFDDGTGTPTPEPALDPELERLNKIIRDKDGMGRSERNKRREAEQRAEALEQRLAALEGKARGADDIDFAQLASVEDDPIGNIEAVRKLAERMAAQDRQNQQQSAQQRQFEAINARMTEFEADYRAETPDYDDAMKHLREAKMQELEDQGYSKQEAQNAMANEFVGIVLRSMQSGRDPAEVAYNLAKRRGYAKSGGAVAEASAEKIVDNQDKILQTIERGQKAAKSLSATPRGGNAEITLESLNSLDGEAFDRARAQFKKQMRGG